MKVELTEKEANTILACLNGRKDAMQQLCFTGGMVVSRAFDEMREDIDSVKTKVINAWQADE